MVSTARMDELRKKFDENPRRYFAPLANEYRKVGDLEQAIFICQEYLPQQPGHMSGHIVYGQALFESGRQEEARAVFETALALDPENLIALRHLGDIAAHAGDLTSARQWYQRVLEADPRNEEIAALIQALPAAAETPSDVETASSSTFQTVGEQSLAGDDLEAHESAQAAPGDSNDTPDRLDIEHASGFDSADTIEVESPVAHAEAPPAFEQTLDLEISIPGVEANGGSIAGDDLADVASGPEAPSSEAQPHEAPSDGAPAADDGGLLDLDDFALPGSEPPPPADADLPLSDPYGGVLGAAPPESPMPEEAGDAAAASSGPPLGEVEFSGELAALDAGTLEAFAGDAAVAETWVVESTTAPPPAPPDLAVDGAEPSSEQADEQSTQPGAVPEAFVTETMAELYLRQGHVTEALDLYDRLMAQRPYDDGLAARAAAARQQALGGPTIREFLAGIFHPNGGPAATRGPAATDALWAGSPTPSADDERIAGALARGFGSDAS